MLDLRPAFATPFLRALNKYYRKSSSLYCCPIKYRVKDADHSKCPEIKNG